MSAWSAQQGYQTNDRSSYLGSSHVCRRRFFCTEAEGSSKVSKGGAVFLETISTNYVHQFLLVDETDRSDTL